MRRAAKQAWALGPVGGGQLREVEKLLRGESGGPKKLGDYQWFREMQRAWDGDKALTTKWVRMARLRDDDVVAVMFYTSNGAFSAMNAVLRARSTAETLCFLPYLAVLLKVGCESCASLVPCAL